MAHDCPGNEDPLKLVREGSSQPQRLAAALAPGFAPVDQRGIAHGMLFARAFAAYLKYYRDDGLWHDEDWTPFFDSDASVRLALAAVQDVPFYTSNVKSWLGYLDDMANQADASGLKQRLGYLFSAAATLAAGLDGLRQGLPAELPLQAQLGNLVRSQLAPALRQLLLYYRDGLAPAGPPPGPWHSEVALPFEIMGAALTLEQVRQRGLSKDWIADPAAGSWAAYLARLDDRAIYPPTGVYGSGGTLFERVNHIATHNLFTSVFERFLKVYARSVSEAGAALEASLSQHGTHEPHYALFLSFLRLFESARAEMNTITARHLDLYYRDVLRLKQKSPQPGRVRLLAELARQVPAHLLQEGTLFRAGKDQLGVEALFAATRDVVLNQARVAAFSTVYRHGDEPVAEGTAADRHQGRLFASPVANSGDGLGAPLASGNGSWHPFHNKRYRDGVLAGVDMPRADVGFAIASHYLLMAQGIRTVTVEFDVAAGFGSTAADFTANVACFLTSEEKWIELQPASFATSAGKLCLELELSGTDPAVTPYVPAVHGYNFATGLPLLLLKLRHSDSANYIYASMQDLGLTGCTLSVDVKGLKSLAVSNDFGTVDISKPFQPYGASPLKNSALMVGSPEAFQKKLTSAALTVQWQVEPATYKTNPQVHVDFLRGGEWVSSDVTEVAVAATAYPLDADLDLPVLDRPDVGPPRPFDPSARQGFLRLRLTDGFGQAAYQAALVAWLRKEAGSADPGSPPAGAWMSYLAMDYTATQTIALVSNFATAYDARTARYFHVGPFGWAEQHPFLNAGAGVTLLPQFDFPAASSGTASAAEFYIGVAGLQPPQSLALLFQVADGSADPLVRKPPQHLSFSYLRANRWVRFAPDQVEDQTAGLLASGIVTLQVPRDAGSDNTLLAPALHWIRLSVTSEVGAACRLLLVAAQALEAVFEDHGNDPAFPAQLLAPGTVIRLAEPDAAVKKLAQPFPGFGGRALEDGDAFRTRVSERLRHKDRAIALWDAEHLVLEAFPEIHRARCLNHTQFEPGKKGAAVYRELAPGHVTIVTIPDLALQNLRDPLRPYTGLDLLRRIENFLRPRYSCFVRLHVRNPQFEEVRLAFRLRLHPGHDETFYVNRLREEITRFLSPWAFPGGGLPSFGGKIRKSVLIDFVEERAYVDYVTDFQLFHDIDGTPGTLDRNEVAGSRAVSILVSVPATRHQVSVIPDSAAGGAPEHCPCEAS